jgi:iron complex outermembrane receptor protein
MKTVISILSLLFFTMAAVSPVFCGEEYGSKEKDFDPALEQELKWIRAEAIVLTDIATKTEMDADLAPGIVTVLQGSELEERGIHTVWDALTLIPGLDTSVTANGSLQLTVRGIGNVIAVGKVKIMLNNVPVNSTYTAEAEPVYSIPVEQVERIEFIRGPGAALYGKGAYTGLINVVTRTSENRIFGRYARFDVYTGGGICSYALPEQDFKISLNAAGWERGRSGATADSDYLYTMGMADISEAPGPINDSRRQMDTLLNLEYKDFSVLAQWVSHDHGDYFGEMVILPPSNDRMVYKEDFSMAEARWKPEILTFLQPKFRIGWTRYVWNVDKLYMYPPGFAVYEDGMIIAPYYREQSMYGGVDFQFKEWRHHTLLFGCEYEYAKIRNAYADLNYDMLTGEPLSEMQRFVGEANWIEDGKSRNIFSMFIQDQFDLTERLAFTAGLRYDSYDDAGDSLTPRIAGVFRLSERHIFKAQYAEAFRPPAFVEMYSKNNPSVEGNSNMSSETVKTYEIGYIYKNEAFRAGFTAFHSELDDLIIQKGSALYRNVAGAEAKGAEVELTWKIRHFLLLDANLSYSDVEDRDTGDKIKATGRWLGNAGLVYSPRRDWSVSLQYRHVDKYNRSLLATSDRERGRDTLDISGTVKNLFIKGLTLQTGIRNLFDADVSYPSGFLMYPNDYPQPGREGWIKLAYDFK